MLQQVYINQQNLDDELVNSIVWPAQDSNAAEVFYRIITGKGTPVNVLLDELDKVHRRCPMTRQGSCAVKVNPVLDVRPLQVTVPLQIVAKSFCLAACAAAVGSG